VVKDHSFDFSDFASRPSDSRAAKSEKKENTRFSCRFAAHVAETDFNSQGLRPLYPRIFKLIHQNLNLVSMTDHFIGKDCAADVSRETWPFSLRELEA